MEKVNKPEWSGTSYNLYMSKYADEGNTWLFYIIYKIVMES